MLRVARGSANWLLAPLTLAILMAGGPTIIDPEWEGVPIMASLSMIPLFIFMLMWWFFRDPDRPVGTHIVSPADGKVLWMDVVDDPDLGPCDRLSIFMGIQDVHVNRMPIDADVRRVTHRPGKHIPAFNKDSERNEQVQTIAKTEKSDMKVIQIAGAVARRIVPYIDAGDHLAKADRMGLIRLGSRCDLLFPVNTVQWVVAPKQKVRAGVSSVATWLETESMVQLKSYAPEAPTDRPEVLA